MEDLFRKIPSLIKPSKRSSSSSSRSTTPSPPPATLPPPLPTPNIPIQLPVGPLLPPPAITAGNPSNAPIPPATLLPLALTQKAVFQRDQATRVFEHSPLSQQISLSETTSQYQQQQEQIKIQRSRYRFRDGSADHRNLPSRSLSPSGEGRADETRKKKNNPLISSSPLTIPHTAENDVAREARSKPAPATTFEEILGIDGAPGADYSSLLDDLLDDPSVSVSGSPATESGTPIASKDPKTGIISTYSNPTALARVDGIGSVIEMPQPLILYRTDSLASLVSATAEPRLANNNNQNEMKLESFNLRERTELVLDDELPKKDIQCAQTRRQKRLGLEYVDGGLGVRDYRTNESLHASRSSSTYSTSDLTTIHGPVAKNPEQESYIPQADGSCASKPRGRSGSPSTSFELFGRPDPFGVQATEPTQDAIRIAEQGHQVSFLQRCQDFFTSNAHSIKKRTVRVLTTRPNTDNTADVNIQVEGFGESKEDIGTRKAKAVARSWNRADLVTCYVL